MQSYDLATTHGRFCSTHELLPHQQLDSGQKYQSCSVKVKQINENKSFCGSMLVVPMLH
jgi:hypothetical protein